MLQPLGHALHCVCRDGVCVAQVQNLNSLQRADTAKQSCSLRGIYNCIQHQIGCWLALHLWSLR